MSDPVPSPAFRPDPWEGLRRLTSARIALGRAGGSIPSREWLDFSLAHARARDAVHAPFDAAHLAAELAPLGLPVLTVATAATTRHTYLQRPDLGRRLSESGRTVLEQVAAARPQAAPPIDLAILVSDGLSARATQQHAATLLAALVPALQHDGWQLAPITIAVHGRVALEDEVGALFGATLTLIVLGERPGLGSPDSLGAYFVHTPAPGRTDAERNCVSNIRPEGLAPAIAAETLHHLLTESRRRKLSGVQLKDERGAIGQNQPSPKPCLS